MMFSACWLLSTALQISSETSSRLSLLGLFLWALVLFLVMCVLARHAWTALQLKSATRKKQQESNPSTTANFKGWARYTPIIFAAACCGLMGVAVERQPKFEIATEHNVQVLQQISPNTWRMSSAEEGAFLYTGCDDFPNASVIWAGYIADEARWEERGKCKSIRATGLFFHWKRDPKNQNVEEISHERSQWSSR
jgi:hypothetical protein